MGMMMGAAADLVTDRTVASPEDSGSIADLFLAASRDRLRELAGKLSVRHLANVG